MRTMTPTRRMMRVVSALIAQLLSTRKNAAKPILHIPVVVGGIEASLRRLAHYDYWSESVKRRV